MEKDPIKLLENGDTKELSKWTEKLDNKMIKKLIGDRKGSHELISFLRAMLVGCQSLTAECLQRLYVYGHCMDLIHGNELPKQITCDLIALLLLHTDLLSGSQLAELIHRFLDVIKNGQIQSEKAIELLPKLLSSLETKERVVIGSSDMKGSEYKSHVITSLCSTVWSCTSIPHLAAAFKDVQLSTDELKLIIEKIIQSFSVVDIHDVPALVYQLFILSSKGHKRLVLEGIIDFFAQKDSEAKPDNNSEDLLESENTMETLHHTEGTVIVHAVFATKLDHDLGSALIKYLKAQQPSSSHVVFSPFVLALTLSIAKIPRFQQQIFDFLKTTILKTYKDQERKLASHWLRQMTSDNIDISALAFQTVSNSMDCAEHVTQGLVELGFTLMDSFGPRAVFGRIDNVQVDRGSPRYQACNFGTNLLLQTFKLHEMARADILEQISNRVISRANSPIKHYTDLLSRVTQAMPQALLDSSTHVREIFDCLPLLPPSSAEAILHSIHPLLKLSITLRDALMLVLRKALFSKKLDSRKVGILGLLILLKNFRILGALPCSQSSQSFSLSQVQVNVHQRYNPAGNRALCLEIIGNLRRCINQQADIRVLLYEGLYNVVCKNSQVCGAVLDILRSQVCKYFDASSDTMPPLQISSCISQQGIDTELIEPIGHLLACSQKILVKCQDIIASEPSEEEKEDLLTIYSLFTRILTELMKKLLNCELEDFQLDKSSDFSSTTNTGRKNVLTAQLLLGVCEALMEHIFMQSDDLSEESCNQMLQLFTLYTSVRDLIEKAAANKKSKTSSLKHKSHLSFDFLKRIMDILYIDTSSNNRSSLDLLLSNSDFMHYLVVMATQRLQELQTGGLTSINDKVKNNACFIARALFKCYVENQRCDTAPKKAVRQNLLTSCLDGLNIVYTLVLTHTDIPLNLTLMERDIDDSERVPDLQTCVMGHIKKFQRLVNNIVDSTEEIYSTRDLQGLLIIIQSLYKQLNMEPENLKTVNDWITQICERHELEDPASVKQLLTMLLNISKLQKNCLPCISEMCRDIHSKLADIDPELEVEERNCYRIINDRTITSVTLQLVNTQTELELDDIEWAITGLKAQFGPGANHDSSQGVRDKHEKAVCSHLGHIITAYHEIIQTSLPAGTSVTSVLKVIERLYGVLVLFVKYFISKFSITASQPTSKFEKLVKLSGTHLTQHVYSFINYVQTVSNEHIIAGFDKTKKSKSKSDAVAKSGKVQVLKEIKVIPSVIYCIEQYECFLIQLSKKLKTDLMEHIKHSTSRDFRINTSLLEQRHLDSDSDNEDGDDEDENEDETVDDNDKENESSPQIAIVGNNDSVSHEQADEPPPTKKSRKLLKNKQK